MSFIHIKSDQPSLVYIDGVAIGEINEENHYCLDLEVSSSFMLFALPMSKSLPITTLVDLTCCKNKDQDIKIVPFYNNHFDLYLNWCHNKTAMPIKELAYFATKDKSIGVYNNGSTYICAYLNGSLKNTIDLNKEFTSANIEEIDDKYCVVAECDNVKYGVILDDDLQVIFKDEISMIEKTPEHISILSPLHDLFGHCKVSKLGAENETYFVYEENFPKFVPPSLNTLALLQCVKVKNMSLVKDLLSPSLRNKSETLQEYIGEIDNIYYNAYSVDKQNYTIESNSEFKSFSFVTDNGRIKDIHEEDFILQ